MGKEKQIEGTPQSQKEKRGFFSERRIIDMLDIQVLLAIIVFFVSAWAYLYGVICEFTTTEPPEERMAYILVHYILTIVLLLCIIITYVKGRYLLNTEASEFTTGERQYIDLFIDGWAYALLISVIILTLNTIDWRIWSVISILVLIIYMIYKKFNWKEILVINSLIVLCFPAFISLMTNITKNIEINTFIDKDTDIVTITVDPKSYDGEYNLIGLMDTELQLGEQYTKELHVIKVPLAFIHNNELVLGFSSPAGNGSFWKYGIAKIFNKEKRLSVPKNASVYKKKIIMNPKKD